jgi:hypothetical protein
LKARLVRIDNAAAAQMQLDVRGEIADAMFQALLHGLPSHQWEAAPRLRPGARRAADLDKRPR